MIIDKVLGTGSLLSRVLGLGVVKTAVDVKDAVINGVAQASQEVRDGLADQRAAMGLYEQMRDLTPQEKLKVDRILTAAAQRSESPDAQAPVDRTVQMRVPRSAVGGGAAKTRRPGATAGPQAKNL